MIRADHRAYKPCGRPNLHLLLLLLLLVRIALAYRREPHRACLILCLFSLPLWPDRPIVFRFTEPMSAWQLPAVVQVLLVPMSAYPSAFFPLVEHNSLSGPLTVVPVPLILVPEYEYVEWSQKTFAANNQ